jgi:endonuclease/exonuclease/phosphatase family metal-dependent hydrolase
MRFMTWNVWGRFGGNWQRRQRRIARTIRTNRPDLVALQESWVAGGVRQSDILGAELHMSSIFAPSRMPQDPDPSVRLGLAILSRYPFATYEWHHLTDETVALRAEIRLGERGLHFLNTCLDWEEDRERERLNQAEALVELVSELSESGDPVVLAGDLNAPPDRPEIKRLLSVLHDCRPDPGITYSSQNPYLGKGEWIEDERIDYVLATFAPGTERRCRAKVVGTDPEPPPSDHYAVVTDIPVLT